MSASPSSDPRPALSRSDLEAFDPQGRGNRWLCPLCGDSKPRDSAHRSLSLDESTGLWKCFRCGSSGKLKDNWETHTPLSYKEQARRKLKSALDLPPKPVPVVPPPSAEEVPLEPASHTPPVLEHSEILLPLENTVGAKYLAGRGITLETAIQAGVKFAPAWSGRPAVVFELYDQLGQAIASQGRFVDGRRNPPAITNGPKKSAIFSTQQPTGPNWFRKLPCIILTEAPIDALSLAEVRYPALAFCGTSGPDWLHVLCGLRTVLLAFDADEAGDRAAEHVTAQLRTFGARCHRLRPEGAKDWNEMLAQFGPEGLEDWLAMNALGLM